MDLIGLKRPRRLSKKPKAYKEIEKEQKWLFMDVVLIKNSFIRKLIIYSRLGINIELSLKNEAARADDN